MRFRFTTAPLASLLAVTTTFTTNSSFFLVTAAARGRMQQQDSCPPKPVPLRNIKFTDKGGEALHGYELRGKARLVEPAPEPVTRALRIDEVGSYALLKGLDISPSKMPNVTIAMGVNIDRIRPVYPDGFEQIIPARGWVLGHDNGGFDHRHRAIFLHDERFNGMGMSPGYEFPGNDRWMSPPLKQWFQIIAIWRQGGECEMYESNKRIQFSEKIIGQNDDGLPDLSIGSVENESFQKANDNDVWVKDVQVWDWALSKEELDALDCDFKIDLEPTIDCGLGGALVESCTDCNFGPGSSAGCNGDCAWELDLVICKENDGQQPTVDCGNHKAFGDCSQCAGDDASASSSGCSGECMWDPSTNTCIDDNDDGDVNCGTDYDVATCELCEASSADTSGCAGECKWDEDSDSCKHQDYVPPPSSTPTLLPTSPPTSFPTSTPSYLPTSTFSPTSISNNNDGNDSNSEQYPDLTPVVRMVAIIAAAAITCCALIICFGIYCRSDDNDNDNDNDDEYNEGKEEVNDQESDSSWC